MEQGWLNLKLWIRDNQLEFWSLVVVLLVGAFLRLYKIDQYTTFLGDEGRDVLIVRRLLVEGHPPLIGPGTSIGNMYLGPIYYYMMAPALLLANFSPVGPAVQIAILGVITIFFVWYVGREWFPSTRDARSGQANWGALVAASLYAISPTVIIYSRSSWNPNIMPFFALASIYSIWKVWQKKYKWLIVLSISYAFVLQSHYLGFLLAPTLFLFWVLTFRNLKLIRNYKLEIINFLRYSAFGLLLFVGLMSPLVIFDARHGWNNFSAMKKFLTERQTTVSFRPWNALPQIPALFENINTRLLAGRNEAVGKLVTIVMVVMAAWLIVKRRILQRPRPLAILLVWLGFALIGLGLYKQQIYDHYYGFFFPAPFLLVGFLVQGIWGVKYWPSRIFSIFVVGTLILVSLLNSPLRNPPTFQLQRALAVAQKIKGENHGQSFNLAVLAERNYEDGYKYFLKLWGEPVIDIDAQKPETVTNQLFVVCEMVKEKCDPTHSPKAEVANYGWSKIESQWEVFGTTLFKLVHSR